MNFALAAVTGLLLVALFPAVNLPYFAPVALAPLLFAVWRESRPGRRFLLGWVAGAIFWGGTCYWIQFVLREHGHVHPAGVVVLFAGFFLVKGLHLGVFAVIAGWLLGRWWTAPAVAAAWIAIEGTHQYAGFTWLMLGSAATNMAVVARLAPITGVAGMSYVLALMNVAVALAFLRRPRKELVWVALVLIPYVLPSLPAAPPGSRLAQLVQANVDEKEVYASPWSEQRAEKLLDELAALSTLPRPPDLIVWPENPAPFYFYGDPYFRSYMQKLARERHTYLLFGTVAFRDPGSREPLNSAVLLAPDGEEVARYDKIHLVPFGEFVPWPFDSLVEKITREAGDFVPGDRVVVAPLDQHRVATFICYESVFGRAVREFVKGGAELLVNISNDGWFGQSAARDQHLLIARMRAIENRRWLLRSTNTGLTAAIDPAGQIRAILPPDQPGALTARFEYLSETTLYTRWGDWFWWAAVAQTVLFLTALFWKR